MRSHWKLFLSLALVVLILGGGLAFWFFFPGPISGRSPPGPQDKAGQGDPDGAGYWYEAALWKDPDNDSARVAYADLLAGEENYSQAEALLYEGLDRDPSDVDYYIALSSLYVRQDKLADASALLDAAEDPAAQTALQDMRPGAPHPSAQPGEYHEKMVLSFTCDATCYLRVDGTYPSVQDTPLADVALDEEKEYVITAVSVAENGLVSQPFTGTYTLSDLVFELQFADPTVEMLVRLALNQPEGAVLSSDARTITQLTNLTQDGTLLLENGAIGTLEDLAILESLESLTLGQLPEDVDLTPVAALPRLTELHLVNSALDSTDLQQLAEMKQLKILDLSGNQVSTLGVLEGLTALERLNLSNNSVADPSPLGALQSLTALDLSHNAVEDLTTLQRLTGLRELKLDTNRISDLSGLAELTELSVLTLSGNQVTSLRPLGGLTALTMLDASANQINSLAGLEHLTSLQELRLNGNQITTIGELQGHSALATLTLDENQIATLEPLRGLTALVNLSAAKNALTDLTPLSGCSALTVLNVEYNQITSLAPLRSCGNLKEVRAFENALTDSDAGEGVTVYQN